MARRELSEEEKGLVKRAITKFEEGKRRLGVKLRELDFMISEGLYNNYIERKDELRAKKRNACQEIQDMDIQLVTLYDQFNNGVVVKETKQKNRRKK